MPAVIKRLDLYRLRSRAISKRQAKLFDIWDANKGRYSSELNKMSDHLVYFGMPMGSCIPQIMYMGDKSLAKMVMTTGWRNELNEHISDAEAGDPYMLAAHGEPSLESVHFSTLKNGVPKHLEYERLVLQFRSETGHPFLVTLSTATAISIGTDHPPSQQNPSYSMLLASNPILLGSEQKPSLSHLVSAGSSQ